MALELRPYQIEGRDRMVREKRLLLADEMGVGKSPQAATAFAESEAGECLLVAPKPILEKWSSLIYTWTDALPVIYSGTPRERALAWEAFRDAPRPRVLITNYAQVKNVMSLQNYWNAYILDECHHIKNPKSKTFLDLARGRRSNVWLLSGTPMSRGPQDLWTYLHLMDPQTFRGFWPFANRWLTITRTRFGQQIGPPKNPAEFQAMMKRYSLRRTKKDVMPWLPPKTRDPIYVDLTPEQKRLYRELRQDDILELRNGEYFITQGALAKITRLRQMCLSPQLLDDSLPAKSSTFAAAVEFLDSLNEPCVVFTPWTSVFPLFAAEVLPKLSEPWEFHSLRGGDDYHTRIQAFENSRARRKILMSTISLGAGWDIHTATHALFLGSEWSPTLNFQSEDRLRGAANIYYIVHKHTVEMHVLDVLNEKKTWAELAMSPDRLFDGVVDLEGGAN